MHIPDNFLSTPVWAGLDAVAIPAVALVSRKAQRTTEPNRLPLLGVMGAFVFAAQMINFPVGMGTSGHLVGGTLLACVLGPWAAALVVTGILIIQALVFQDGGVLALGANIINMALMGVVFGYLPARVAFQTKWKSYGIFLGGVCSVLVSGALALSELRLSGIPLSSSLVEISLLLFFINAILEGAITLSVVRGIERISPGATVLLSTRTPVDPRPARRRAGLTTVTAVTSLLLVSAGVLFASTMPDRIEQLAIRLGVPFGRALLHTPLSGYRLQGLGPGWFSRSAAGLAGLLLIYVLCSLGGHLISRVRRSYT